jgi:hypothetical protein
MLTLSRAGSPITCQLEQEVQAGVRQPMQHLTRSLRGTLVSIPMTPVALLVGHRYDGRASGPRLRGPGRQVRTAILALPMRVRRRYSMATPPSTRLFLSRRPTIQVNACRNRQP